MGRQARLDGGFSDSSSRCPPTAGCRPSAATICSIQSSATMSSASQNSRNRPRAMWAAAARAPLWPSASAASTMCSGRWAAAAWVTCGLLSVDPLSLTITSQGPW